MNTPAHLIFGAATFAPAGRPAVTTAAILGALLPDPSLYIMAGGSVFVFGMSPDHVFIDLYFSDAWQPVVV